MMKGYYKSTEERYGQKDEEEIQARTSQLKTLGREELAKKLEGLQRVVDTKGLGKMTLISAIMDAEGYFGHSKRIWVSTEK